MSSEKTLEAELSKTAELVNLHEAAIARSVGEIYHTATHPAIIIKKCVRDLAADKDLRSDLGKLAVHAFARTFTRPKTKNGLLARIVPTLINFFLRNKG